MSQSHFSYKVLDPIWIPMPDGVRLAARIWMPESPEQQPLPAVLEFLPYRRRDGTLPRDESTYPVFAEAGFVGIRVDQRGTGDSDGLAEDEYAEQELSDAETIIHWITQQDWSNGHVGMMGISWGGFNALQVAARKPPGLKAVISIGSTVDRYHDDIHYKGGAHLSSNFSWASTMLCYNARPPEPGIRTDWREQWLTRLKSLRFPLKTWLEHPTRDAYWQHGSVNTDYSQMTIPALVISGWADGYHNAPPTAAQHFPGVCKAINGPWIHKYPHFAWPKPRIDFHQQALNWWRQWLSDEDQQQEVLPDYRAYVGCATQPGSREQENGFWISQQNWPSPDSQSQILHLCSDYSLQDTRQNAEPKVSTLCLQSSQTVGLQCGEFFPVKPDADLSGDQSHDDQQSLCWQTAPLEKEQLILGRPTLRLQISSDQPNANLVARLVDVHPDGRAYRVSLGVLNLAQRHSDQDPEAMPTAQSTMIELALNECAYCFKPRHRIRLSLSSSYWPYLLPTRWNSRLTIACHQHSQLILPTLSQYSKIEFKEPSNPNPLPDYINHQPAEHKRWVEQDLQSGLTHYKLLQDSGIQEHPELKWISREIRKEHYQIHPRDPLSAICNAQYQAERTYGDHHLQVSITTQLQCLGSHFRLQWQLQAFENENLIYQHSETEQVERTWL